MRVLFISKEGDGLGVAHKMAMEGVHVDFWIKNPRFHLAGKGIVNRVETWRRSAVAADLIVCDMVGFGSLLETFKLLGKPVVSCDPVLEMAELDRTKGMQLFRAVGIEIPDTYDCKNGDEAVEITRKLPWEGGWVIKPQGNISTAKTMVITDQEEWKWALSTIPAGLIIQRVVEGIEISTEGWWNGRGFVRPFNHTFEEKKFLNDNLGPATGCMGNVVLAAPSNKLTKATVERLEPFLRTLHYRGPVDVNCIVSRERAAALEITARMGYDAVEALVEGLREPVIDLFFECALGVKKEMKLDNRTMMAVRLSIPPWPHAKPKEEDHGEPVLGLDDAALKHIAVTDLYRERGTFYTAGGDGVLCKVTATGGTGSNGDITREASRRCYATLERIRVSGKQYRTDIGERVNKDIKQLREWGWI